MPLSEEQLTEKYRPLVRDPLELYRVQRVNFRPHPVMIGPEHVAHACDNYSGILGRETIDALGCGWRGENGNHGPRCGRKSSEHTSDLVVFVKAIRDCENREAVQSLFAIKEQMVEDKIDGVAFIESPFTIAPPKEEGS